MPFLDSNRARAAVAAAGLFAALALPAAANATTAAAPGRLGSRRSGGNSREPGAALQPHRSDHVHRPRLRRDPAQQVRADLQPAGQPLGAGSPLLHDLRPGQAGIMAFLAGNDYGVNDGSPYWDQRLNKPSLLGQLDHAHKSWKEYVQNIPYGGYLGDCYPIFCQAVGDSVPVTSGNAASLIEYGSATGAWKTVPSPDPGAPQG